MALCPKCGAKLDLEQGELAEGNLFSCAECNAVLTVVTAKPVQIALANDGAGDEDDEGDSDDLDDDDDDSEDDEDEIDDEISDNGNFR